LRMGRESGMAPQQIAQLLVKFPEIKSSILSEISKVNTGRVLGVAEMNSQNALKAGMINNETNFKDKALSLEEDKMRNDADARSKDTLNKASAWGAGLFGQYSQNKLSSGVIEKLYRSGDVDALSLMYRGMLERLES
jgi:hypothetical protein